MGVRLLLWRHLTPTDNLLPVVRYQFAKVFDLVGPGRDKVSDAVGLRWG